MRPFFRVVLLLSLSGAPCLQARALELSASEVAQAIADRRSKVAEFQLIKEAADELGLRVWLFGGTAAGFAHYVRWDLEREAGDARYPATFLDYDFTNIYRSTQDADLVVDGTPQQAEALERLIKEKMSFLQGSKEHWEVRLLRTDRVAPGGQLKQALLANHDFLGQHTDSNSTGMIELTEPPPRETVVRDLRDWESAEPFFLKDVTAGRLHYYWSETHGETARAKEGSNPPLFSVIRYLVKAFQYDLKIEGEDRARIQRIIDEFDPQRDPAAMSEWARGWLERYGPNLIRHAVNIEKAWNTLQDLGLREKLIALSDPSRRSSLGWWLSKEPLRSRPVGGGDGKTAAELGLTMVAHETREFVDYESITRDMTGRPNVLISRKGFPGEMAALGAGFYTLGGRSGAQGTGLTVRFRVDPQAREGADFTVHEGGVVLFHNRAALRVIPESLDLSIVEYFQMLAGGAMDWSDRGVAMKLRRRLSLKPVSPGEEDRLVEVVSTAIRAEAAEVPLGLLAEWFQRPSASRHPELMAELIESLGRYGSGWEDRVETRELFLSREVLPRPEWLEHPELVRMLMGRSVRGNNQILRFLLKRSAWARHPQLMEALIRDGRVNRRDLQMTLEQDCWRARPELLRAVSRQISEDREGSPLSRSLAYREAGNALVQFALAGRGPRLMEVKQYAQDDGTFNYNSSGQYGAGDPERPLGTTRDTLHLLAGVYGGLLATSRAGLSEAAPSRDGYGWSMTPVGGPGLDSRELTERGPWIRRLGEAALAGDRAFWASASRTVNGIPGDPWSWGTGKPIETEAGMDGEIERLMASAERVAGSILERSWPAVEALAKALLRQEGQLSGAEVEAILQGAGVPDVSGQWGQALQVTTHLRSGNQAGCEEAP